MLIASLGRAREEGTIVDEVTRDGDAAPVSERLQALLSQAVQEQVAEQRAVSAELAGLRGQLACLADVVGTAPTAGDLARLQETVACLVDDVRAATTRLDQRLDALDALLSSRTGTTGQQAQPLQARPPVTSSLAPPGSGAPHRPVVRREPVLEATPDLDEEVLEPVRTVASSWPDRPDRGEAVEPSDRPWWRPTT